ncbi:RNA polymerase sigma factor (sigma-70 family) [Allocatelliglobosispora scoriae]|uniref:RNA polymerase sigma factor (Sigma-70 family) n=1 Tax=Allocatelliglobosispora scoriae TaxID=643052 RepID=A0A841BMU7_9ACTN|nr:RNA polymerase sigma factor (sigma-70 family) [Allocatelliglobosispora scoriae]
MKRFAKLREADDQYRWLYSTAFNFVRRSWYRQRIQRRYLAVNSTELPDLPAPVQHDGTFAIDINSYLRRLKPHDREVLLLTVWEELTDAEIVERLGIKENAVRTRRHRAMRKLKDLLMRDGYTEFSHCLAFDETETSNA